MLTTAHITAGEKIAAHGVTGMRPRLERPTAVAA